MTCFFTVMAVVTQSDGQVLSWFQCWQGVNHFLFCSQRRIFVFGALGYSELFRKVCDDWCRTNYRYTCSIQSRKKLFQFINIILYF